MNIKHRTLCTSLLAVFACALPSAAPAPADAIAAMPGPGGVYQVVERVLGALDRVDEDALDTLFAARVGGIAMSPGGALDKQGELPFSFWEEAATAHDSAGLARHARSMADPKLGPPVSKITTFRGDCPSADCSWATFEFERTWGEGEDAKTASFRATALVRHDSKSKSKSGFEVMHWHASPR